MAFDIALGLVTLMVSIGFYTRNLDWILIYYGCAPPKEKAKMPGDKIMDIAFISMILITVLQFVAAFMVYINFTLIQVYIHIINIIIIMIMLIWTFILAIKAKDGG